MKSLGDYLHSLGLRFGIYSDTSNVTCEGFPGSMGHERTDAADYAAWGVDYLKYDYCGMKTAARAPRYYYELMRDALNSTGRHIHYNICSWGAGNPWLWGQATGNSWRTGRDVFAVWDRNAHRELRLSPILQSILESIEVQAGLAAFAGPGGFNDPDMLVVGLREGMSAYGMVEHCPPHLPKAACVPAGEAPVRDSLPMPPDSGEFVSRAVWGKVGGLTATEERTVFSFWCMLAAPLILGNDPRKLRRSTRGILTAPELIRINQDRLGQQARRVWQEGALQIWRKDLADGSIAVLLFNGGSNVTDIQVQWDRDLPEVAARFKRYTARQPPCLDRRSDCETWASRGECHSYLQNAAHADIKGACMKSCNICPPARVPKGKHAIALVRNTWERDYEGVFAAHYTSRLVEPHATRVFVLTFETEGSPRNWADALIASDASGPTSRAVESQLPRHVSDRRDIAAAASESASPLLRREKRGSTQMPRAHRPSKPNSMPESEALKDARSKPRSEVPVPTWVPGRQDGSDVKLAERGHAAEPSECVDSWTQKYPDEVCTYRLTAHDLERDESSPQTE